MNENDYEAGYKKPPKKGQFKKGKSGNASGRPKGSKNMGTIIADELNREISITENGEQVAVYAKAYLIRMLIAKALKGDLKAVDSLMKIIEGGEKIYFL